MTEHSPNPALEQIPSEPFWGTMAHMLGWAAAFAAPPWVLLTLRTQWMWAKTVLASFPQNIEIETPGFWAVFFSPWEFLQTSFMVGVGVAIPLVVVGSVVLIWRILGHYFASGLDTRARRKYQMLVGGEDLLRADAWQPMDDDE